MRLPNLSRLLRRRSNEPQLSREEALAARPVRNPAITWERNPGGRVLLTVPLQLKPWMRLLKSILQVPSEKKVELDEVGSDVWEWLDGQVTVAQLVDQLAAAHKLHRREAEVSLTQFLELLAKRHFLGFALQLDDRRAKELGAAVVNVAAAAGEPVGPQQR
ncbi:MAG: PqqD family protein [Fimbriimonadaceae bacterium]|nr:PqqD family protein [Fimbriimonadaceae bacterium]